MNTMPLHLSWWRTLVASISVSVVAACAIDSLPGPHPETNVTTLEHAFTEEAQAQAAGQAARICAQRKQLSIQTQQSCTLTRCRTSFQCITPEDKKAYGL